MWGVVDESLRGRGRGVKGALSRAPSLLSQGGLKGGLSVLKGA